MRDLKAMDHKTGEWRLGIHLGRLGEMKGIATRIMIEYIISRKRKPKRSGKIRLVSTSGKLLLSPNSI